MMSERTPSGDNNARVTMAVLSLKIDNVSQKIDGLTVVQERTWTEHKELHKDQEARMRSLEACIAGDRPINTRVKELESWQEVQKIRTGRFAAVQTAISALLAALSGWWASRN